jgi:dolichyl-diphosphooligosaccharide--protein glycosyltransferase
VRDELKVKLSSGLSKESLVNRIKSLGKLRPKVNHSSLLTISALVLCVFLAFAIRILPLRWEIQVGSIHLNEFDPYYQYNLVQRMTTQGLLSPFWPTHWIDTQEWYPGGIDLGGSYPALVFVGAVSYDIVRFLGFNIDLMTFLAFLPPLMAALGVFLLYFLGKDLGGKPVGLLAALILAISPAVITKITFGFFTTENVGIFAIPAFCLFFLRAVEEERPINSTVVYSLGSAAVLTYFILGWGASYYAIDLAALFVFVLLLLKRYSRRLFLVYGLTFGPSLLMAISTRTEVGPSFVVSTAVLPAAGVFGLLCLNEIVSNLISAREKFMFVVVFVAGIIGSFIVLTLAGFLGAIGAKFVVVLDPLVRGVNPLIESVAEQAISTWASMYYDVGIAVLFFLIGIFFIARNLTTKNLFVLLFALSSVYFAASMVRVMVILAPAFALVAAIGIVGLCKPFVTLLKEPPRLTGTKKALAHVGKEFSGIAIFLIFIVLVTNLAFSPQSGGVPTVYSQAYQPLTITAGSMSIVPNQPVTQWFDMLKYLNDFQNSSTIVVSWWDYGYWLTILGNVTTLNDNATINETQIANVGFIFMANETYSMNMLKQYGAQYILVFDTFDYQGNWVNWAGGDNGKWTWMAEIAGADMQRFIDTGFIDQASAWQNETSFGAVSNTTDQWVWNDVGLQTTIYKLMAWGKNVWCTTNGVTDPDQSNVTYSMGSTNGPIYFQEEFFSGLTLTPSEAESEYGGIVPLICLYKINWPLYYQNYPSA